MKKIIFAILITMLFTTTANAAKWVELYRDNDISVSADFASMDIKKGAGVITVWEKWSYRSRRVQEKINGRVIAFDLLHKEYNIKNRTYRIISGIDYDKFGNVLHSNTLSYPDNDWGPVAPGSRAETLFRAYKTLYKDAQKRRR